MILTGKKDVAAIVVSKISLCNVTTIIGDGEKTFTPLVHVVEQHL
jgi:hypothetical protein